MCHAPSTGFPVTEASAANPFRNRENCVGTLRKKRTALSLAVAFVACVCSPGMPLAQPTQYLTPGYAAPTTDQPEDDAPLLQTPPPQQDAPSLATQQQDPPTLDALGPDPVASPEVLFRRHLLMLNEVGSTTKAPSGSTSSSTTSSFSTSASPYSSNSDTTSSYSTTHTPGR